MKRNPLFFNVSEKYLFHEVKTRVEAFKKSHPDAQIISLGIGDTTKPLAPTISNALQEIGQGMGTSQGYKGYGPELGLVELREKIIKTLYPQISWLDSDEVFISDGAKSDIGRLQILFGDTTPVALQEPSYPAYFDSSLMIRQKRPITLSCVPTPNGTSRLLLDTLPKGSLVFICSPNNPTGTVFTRSELKEYIEISKMNGHILVFDVAYREYILEGSDLPRSIYEIPGAEEVAIEVGSFSKSCGFSGIRLGWTVVPKALRYADGHSVNKDFTRLITTLFNGASYISQKAGIIALSEQGRKETLEQVSLYKESTKKLKKALLERGAKVYGGDHAPYVWVEIDTLTGWSSFDYFLSKAHIVTTPGIGFGPSGEKFLRMSGFARSDDIDESINRILKLNLRNPIE